MFRRLVLSRPIATFAALMIFGTGCFLGNWQLNRMQEKLAIANDLIAEESAAPLSLNSQALALNQALHHPIIARGTYLASRTVWLENRPHPQGQDPKTGIVAGFYVLTPMRLEGVESIVWVNRGWAPRNMLDRTHLPDIVTPTGIVEVRGIVFEHAARVMNIGSTPVEINESNILQNLDLDQEAKKFDGKQLAFVIRQSANQEIDGLNRDWMVVSSGAEKHQGYAFQWFALAVVALLFWLFTGLKRKNLER
jgi:cytochrome oxidase assembly protein ShyY1